MLNDNEREITLYIENDSYLYFHCVIPALKALAKKQKKGAFDLDKSLKLWKRIVENGMKKYHKEFRDSDIPWYRLLSVQERWNVAEELAFFYEDELQDIVESL